MKQKRLALGRSLAFVVVFLAWLLNAVLRVFFGYLMVTGVPLLDVPVTQGTLAVLNAAFLFLGITGLVTSVGLWTMKRWGYYGTVFLILSTIVFDMWGMTIQFTAAMGFVVPIMVLTYLVLNRPLFLEPTSIASVIL
jgi:hypothetical protein